MNTQDTRREIAKAIGFKHAEKLEYVIFKEEALTMQLWNFIVEDRQKPQIVQEIDKQNKALDTIRENELQGIEDTYKNILKNNKYQEDLKQRYKEYDEKLKGLIVEFVDKVDSLSTKMECGHSNHNIAQLKHLAQRFKSETN